MKLLTEAKLVDFDEFTGNVKEDGGGAGPAASGLTTLASVGTGMGAPVYATRTSAGSADVPNPEPKTQEPKKKKKKKGRVYSYNEYLKQV